MIERNGGPFWGSSLFRTTLLALLVAAGAAQAQAVGGAPSFSARTGHTLGISALTISKDERLILTGGADNVAKLWDVKTGTLLRTFTAPTGAIRGLRNHITSVAMSGPAETVLIGGTAGVRAWNGQTGTLTTTLVRSDYMVAAIALNTAGDLAVVSGMGPPSQGARAFLSVHRKGVDGSWKATAIPLGHIHSIDNLVLDSNGHRLGLAGYIVSKEVSGGVETKPFFAVWAIDSNVPIVPRIIETGSDYPSTEVIGFTDDGGTLIVRDRAKIYSCAEGSLPCTPITSGRVAALSPDRDLIAVAPDSSSGADVPVAAEVLDLLSTRSPEIIGWPDAGSERTNSSTSRLAFAGRDKVVVGFNSGKLALWDRKKGSFDWYVQPKAWAPTGVSILDRDGKMMLLAGERQIRAFDLQTGAQTTLANPLDRDFTVVTLSPNGERAAAGGNSSGLHVWDTRTGALLYSHTAQIGGVISIAFSADARRIALGGRGRSTHIVETEDGSEVRWFETLKSAHALAFSPDGKTLAGGDELGEVNFISLTANTAAHNTLPAPGINATVQAISYEGSGQRLAVGYGNGYNRLLIYNLNNNQFVETEQIAGSINALAFDQAGFRAATVGQDQRLSIWDAQTGANLAIGEHRAIAQGVGLAGSGRRVATYADGAATIWYIAPTGDLKKLLEVIDLDTNWVAVRSDGRFDTGNPEDLRAVVWLMPDDPLRPLAADTYLRGYFEPHLVPRLLGCVDDLVIDPQACTTAFPVIPSLQSLNRIVPNVTILDAQAGPTPGTAVVKVRAESVIDGSQTNDKQKAEAYDLRLFRDGQLVGRCPQTGSGKVTDDCSTFTIRVADREGDVRLSAYAFNEDRVRSNVAERHYPAAPQANKVRPKAYVITIGINAYANSAKNLNYAVKDARDMSRALQKIDGYQVIPITLVSEIDGVRAATGAQIEAVLAALAGRSFDKRLVADLPGIAQLAQATPNDLVILTFSGHGYTSSDGSFYLLPSDSDPALSTPAEREATYISSQQLRDWIEPIDAGQLVMIIDACHSAASVATPGFKPGPMGDSSLGQLAYDKGMRLLAATQVDEAAIETEGLQQGLLTFALVQVGLGLDGRGAKADRDLDGRITLTEWLSFGELQTPLLYSKALAGEINLVRKDSGPDTRFTSMAEDQAQTPTLFNFYRAPEDPVIVPR